MSKEITSLIDSWLSAEFQT